jgi:diguanylate cyclase
VEFKTVNDTWGHAVGEALYTSDAVGRLGGDESAVLLPKTGDVGVVAVARKLLATLTEPIHLDGLQCAVQARIGIALCAGTGRDPSTFLRMADEAMYAVKRTGGRFYAARWTRARLAAMRASGRSADGALDYLGQCRRATC